MIHRYYNNGYYIVLDVNSGAVHVVDELAYEVIGLVDEACQPEEIVARLRTAGPRTISAKYWKMWRSLKNRAFSLPKIHTRTRSLISRSVLP